MKKLFTTLVGLTAAVCMSIGLFACDKGNAAGIDYDFYVKSVGGAALPGVTLELKKGGKTVKELQTNQYGYVSANLEAAEYAVSVSDLPAGYTLATDAQALKTDKQGSDLTIECSSAVIKEEMPSNTRYSIGSVMYDFTVKTSDGQNFTLSSVLEDKKMVLINFWYTTCTWCLKEFPDLNEAYELYEDEVGLIALSHLDLNDSIADFKAENGYSMNMAYNTSLLSAFGVTACPTSVVIDRYGVVVWQEEGAFENFDEIDELFSKYTAYNYVQDFAPVTDTETPPETEQEKVLPTVDDPNPADLLAAVGADGFNGTFSFETEDEYSWPFIVEEGADGKYIVPSNSGVSNSYSIVYLTVELKEGDALAFDYFVSSEEEYDIAYIQIDGVIQAEISGKSENWETCYAYVAEEDGTYELAITYLKSLYTDEGEDEIRLKNFRTEDADKIEQPTYIFRYAATHPVDKDISIDDPEPRYASYITPVLNEEDGYYHVGAADGPLLLCDMLYGTPWNMSVSLNLMAYSGLCTFQGIDYSEAITDYAWLASNSDNGYTPVDAELKYLLDLVTENSEYGYGNTDGNEWLEFCLYFDHYGEGEHIGNPIVGISLKTAITVTEGTFTADINKLLMPRGFYHKFTAERSGVYSVYSVADDCDPVGWIADESGEIIADSDNDISKADNNFYFMQYIEAGETRYILCADFDLYFLGKYDVTIEYVAQGMRNFTSAADLPYTFDESGKVILQESLDYVIDEDGYLREKKADGSYGSYIYLDLLRNTQMFASTTIKQILNNTKNGYDDPDTYGNNRGTGFDFSIKTEIVEVRDDEGNLLRSYEAPVLDAEGNLIANVDDDGNALPNYTDMMFAYLTAATAENAELYGFAKIDEQLLEILLLFTQKYDGFGGVENSWQAMCYYYQELGLVDENSPTNAPDLRAEQDGQE